MQLGIRWTEVDHGVSSDVLLFQVVDKKTFALGARIQVIALVYHSGAHICESLASTFWIGGIFVRHWVMQRIIMEECKNCSLCLSLTWCVCLFFIFCAVLFTLCMFVCICVWSLT